MPKALYRSLGNSVRSRRQRIRVVGGLKPVFYRQVVSGTKNVENRFRVREDELLARLEPGDELVLFCNGKPEAARCRVRGTTHWYSEEKPHPYYYAIGIELIEVVPWPREARRQGIVEIPPV